MNNKNLIAQYLAQQNPLIIDGGLATELENRGVELDTALWSAHLLIENPSLIRDVHLAYLEAGADVIITASYQASIPGFRNFSLTTEEATSLIGLSADLACLARDVFCVSLSGDKRLRPLVAASVGPYGASLADGSEYHGDYGISRQELADFHWPRIEILARSNADLLAIETIPSRMEAQVLCDLLQEFDDVYAWMSFSCKDERHISDGTLFREIAVIADDNPRIAAVGVNCTNPEYVSGLLDEAGSIETPLLAYPNSGEAWDVGTREWVGKGSDLSIAHEWVRNGASLVGGCCRVGPQAISDLRKLLVK
ncbi:MAG TPA: homocysteine S-methyltransferase [Xanthomonadales bacterium]|nr:homocysteine S-methyltransferase [Xanthomonadales bacterium]